MGKYDELIKATGKYDALWQASPAEATSIDPEYREPIEPQPRDVSLSEALFPRSKEFERSKGSVQGETPEWFTDPMSPEKSQLDYLQILDIATIPQRAIASLPALMPGGENYKQAMARKGAREGQSGLSAFADEALRDPTLIPSLAIPGVGPETKPLAKTAMGTVKRYLPRLGKKMLGAGAEGLVSGTMREGEDLAMDGEFDPKNVLIEGGASALMPIAQDAVMGVPKAANKLLGQLSSEITTVPEQALRTMGPFNPDKDMVRKFAGEAYNIGQRAKQLIDNPWEQLPEWNKISGMLDNMRSVDVSKGHLKNLVRTSMIENPIDDAARRANATMNRILKDIDNMPQNDVNAKQIFKIREMLDKSIDWDNPEKSMSNQARVDLRDKFKDLLIDMSNKSGNPEYEETMKQFAKKLEAVSNARKVLGKNPESAVQNLFRKGKTESQESIRALKDVFGEEFDFIDQAKYAQMAEQLGMSPEWQDPTLLPKTATANRLLALTGVGSPYLSSKVLLPTATGLENIGNLATQGLGGKATRVPMRQMVNDFTTDMDTMDEFIKSQNKKDYK